MAFAPLIIMAVGAVVAAKGAADQARAQANAQNYNAAIAARNAVIARDQAARDAQAQQRNAYRQLGAMRAAVGASGVTMEGSALDLMESSAAEAELDRLNIQYKGELKATGYNEEAVLDRYGATNAVRQGQYQSASILLTTAGKAYGSAAGSSIGTSASGAAGGASASALRY